MNSLYIGGGVLLVLAGAYIRTNPNGAWNRLAAEHTGLRREHNAEENMARGAPVLGALMVVCGAAAVVAGLLLPASG